MVIRDKWDFLFLIRFNCRFKVTDKHTPLSDSSAPQVTWRCSLCGLAGDRSCRLVGHVGCRRTPSACGGPGRCALTGPRRVHPAGGHGMLGFPGEAAGAPHRKRPCRWSRSGTLLPPYRCHSGPHHLSPLCSPLPPGWPRSCSTSGWRSERRCWGPCFSSAPVWWRRGSDTEDSCRCPSRWRGGSPDRSCDRREWSPDSQRDSDRCCRSAHPPDSSEKTRFRPLLDVRRGCEGETKLNLSRRLHKNESKYFTIKSSLQYSVSVSIIFFVFSVLSWTQWSTTVI